MEDRPVKGGKRFYRLLPPVTALCYSSNVKLLDTYTNNPSRKACAAEVMDAALWIVRFMKAEIGKARPGDLSLNQVRALAVLQGQPDCALTAVAEVLALTAPSTSHLVDGLVKRHLADRRV